MPLGYKQLPPHAFLLIIRMKKLIFLSTQVTTYSNISLSPARKQLLGLSIPYTFSATKSLSKPVRDAEVNLAGAEGELLLLVAAEGVYKLELAGSGAEAQASS